MSEHECVIGCLYDYDNTKLVTVNELLEEVKYSHDAYKYLCDMYNKYDINQKLANPYTLKDYCDKRKSTNLSRFEICPYCGKKIDWKKIKSEGNKNEEM